MFGIRDFPLFVLSCILLNITPGKDTMYIIGRSVAQGKQAGVMSVLGIMTMTYQTSERHYARHLIVDHS